MAQPETTSNAPIAPSDNDTWVDNGERRPIPQPPENWLLGNITDLDPVTPILSLRQLARLYGPIYQLRLIGTTVIISSQKLVHFISNEDKFEKVLSSPLKQVRNFAGDGLFTATAGEHNWTLAHRILIPAFGPLAIKNMQGMMMEIITQMLVSWEVHAGQPFEAADSFTRLTFVGRLLRNANPRTRSAGVRSGTASTRSSRPRCTRSSISWSTCSPSRVCVQSALELYRR